MKIKFSILILIISVTYASPREQIDLESYDRFIHLMFSETNNVHAMLAIQIVEDFGIKNGRVLELAFGAPYISLELAKLTDAQFNILVEDSVELEICKHRIEKAGLQSRFTLHMGKTDSLLFDDESFDLVLARDAMRFWHDKPQVYKEINRILKKSAVAFLGGGLGREFPGAKGEDIWCLVQDWRNKTDHVPWAATLPFPEHIETALIAAGINNYEVWTEGHCTCRTWVKWTKTGPAVPVIFDLNYIHSIQDSLQDIGKPAINFTLCDIDGNAVKLSDLQGEVVVLDFWAVSCRSCLNMMKLLAPIRERFEVKGCRFLAINIDDEKSTLKDFLKDNTIPYTVLFDDQQVARAYKIRGIPHFVIINRQGIISSRIVGGTPATVDVIVSELIKLTEE